MSSKAGSLPCSHPQRESVTHNFYLDSSWRCKEIFPISQALKSSSSWAAEGSCATDFQRSGVAHGRASGADTPILDIWTEPDSKTSSAVLCLLWHPHHNECDQPEGVQKPWICGKICFTEAELKLCVFNLLMKSADGLLIVY